jgi:hypothetical protein
MGGYAVASRLNKGKERVSSQKENPKAPKEVTENQQKAIAVFILVNLVRSIDHEVEAMTIRTNPYSNQLETDFNQKGRRYRCSITIESSEYRGHLWSLANGEPVSLTDPKTIPPPCQEDNAVKRIYNDWLALKPKLPLLPISFVLSLDGGTSQKTL